MGEIKECLDQYCKWTGQVINVEKSGCFFSKNTRGRTKAMVKQALNMKEIRKDAKYLRNPLFVGRNKTYSFEDLRSPVEGRIIGWKAKLLSKAGRATLVKSVITTIHAYAMASCKLPVSWCWDVNKLAMRFFWIGSDPRPSSLLLLDGIRSVCPKLVGGLVSGKWKILIKPLCASLAGL